MITNEVIANLENKDFYGSAGNQKKLTAAEQIIIESEYTDRLQRLVAIVNRRYLRNFSLRLEMDYHKEVNP